MENLNLICENRLKNILLKDKEENPRFIQNVLKSDILFLLKNYMDISAENLNIEISVSEFGTYKINIVGYSNRIKIARYI